MEMELLAIKSTASALCNKMDETYGHYAGLVFSSQRKTDNQVEPTCVVELKN